jgi:hypothetical protein
MRTALNQVKAIVRTGVLVVAGGRRVAELHVDDRIRADVELERIASRVGPSGLQFLLNEIVARGQVREDDLTTTREGLFQRNPSTVHQSLQHHSPAVEEWLVAFLHAVAVQILELLHDDDGVDDVAEDDLLRLIAGEQKQL